MDDDWDEEISAFLVSFPTYHVRSKPEPEDSSGRLLVFSNKDEVYENNSYSSDDAGTRTMFYEKIISAFSKMDKFSCRYGTIVQLWAPVTSGGKHQLSTSGQPFAVNWLAPYLKKYRCCVSECTYDIDVNSTFRGIPASTFFNRFPEIVLDMKEHHESSLMRYASDCGLWTSYTLPIGCPSLSHSSCIGVVECSSLSPFNLEFVKTMKRALEQEGLNVFNVQDRINAINGLTHVRDEIQVALKSVCDSHKIGVAQVWISYEDENQVPFSFSSGDTQTKHRLALKLTGCNSDLRFKEYCDAYDMVPLKMGKEFVGKTLQDHQPRFCENIVQLVNDSGTDSLMAWVSADVACSGFTIYTSIDTGDFSCAFEFIWHHNPDYVRLLKALFSTLESHLPRFKFGAEHPLDVIHVDFLKIFEVKRTTKEITLSREEIVKHYGKTEKEAAKALEVSVSTLKRKCKQLGIPGWQGPIQQKKMYNPIKNQGNKSQTHQKDIGVIQENTVIKAEYADDIIKLQLPISDATFATVENEIAKEFKLKHGTFKIKYRDEDEDWILVNNEFNWNDCIQSSRNVYRSVVRIRVLLHN